jgi:hypothetical protein
MDTDSLQIVLARCRQSRQHNERMREAAAMGDAALAGDFDEARFRASLIIETADAAGLVDVVLAAARTLDQLGPAGGTPKRGYGTAILLLADRLASTGYDLK